MRFLPSFIMLFVASCSKSEPKEQVKPAATPPVSPAATASAAPAPTPSPAPSPTAPPAPAADPQAAAIKATIAILEAVTPITREWGDEGKNCTKGIPEIEKVLEGMKAHQDLIASVRASRESAIAYDKAYWKQDEGPLDNAKSEALGPALHCPDLVDRIQQAFGMPPVPR